MGSLVVSPAHPGPLVSLAFSLLATANCWPKPDLYVWTEPPKRHARCTAPHPLKVAVLNLKTNHQSTGCPLLNSGTGALDCAHAGAAHMTIVNHSSKLRFCFISSSSFTTCHGTRLVRLLLDS